MIQLIFECYFFHPAVFSRALQKSKNTPGSDLVFRTRLLVFPENKIRTHTI